MPVFLPEQSADDGIIYDDVNDMINLNGANLGLGYYGAQVNIAGIRFRNITIPKSATILTAKITLQASQSKSGDTCKVRIKGEATDNATTFSTYADFVGRGVTTAYVDWTLAAWTADTDYDSPEIKTIIQEIVNRAGWASLNSLVLFLVDNGSTDALAWRTAKQYDYSTTLCARLTITAASSVRNNIMIF
jgi:hypothetical protein